MTESSALDRLSVSRETNDRLEALETLLKKWNPAINLVSKKSLSDAWRRHIIDSAQLFALAPAHVDHWVDLGSGGGFPGLVIAVLAAEFDPARRITLVEADQRKCAFLREAARQLGVKVDVRADRIESLAPLGADVLSARALAALQMLCGFCDRHLSPDGVALFPKGASYQDELADARHHWTFDVTVHPSDTEASAVVLEMKAIAHV